MFMVMNYNIYRINGDMCMGNINPERCAIGIELGSTRIKAVLSNEKGEVLASGSYEWENSLENGLWTYSLEDAEHGLSVAYSNLKKEVKDKYGITLKRVSAIGISAMMHGYLVFDKDGNQLVPFRTWRNNNAEPAAGELTSLFNYPIPARWSIAHLYQAILNNEEHLPYISHLTTLAGYIHERLTGEKVIGLDDASGIMPVDINTKTYDAGFVSMIDVILAKHNLNYKLEDVLPAVLQAGQDAGHLTKEGARLLDKDGDLEEGILFAPPEGDAATGMVATNSLVPGTGNVSAGTSIFGMIVIDKPLSNVYPNVDIVATPSGDLCAMVHCNNCTSDLNAWISVLGEASSLLSDTSIDKNSMYEKLYTESLKGDHDCGGVIIYNFVSGENVVNVENGRPMVVRTPNSNFTLANFIRSSIYSSMMSLKIGMDSFLEEEHVPVRSITGHGGVFKTEGIYQQYLADALNAPVSVLETTGEGGPYGMSLLALYAADAKEESLQEFLNSNIFCNQGEIKTLYPTKEGVEGMNVYKERYMKGLMAETEAAKIK